MKRIIFLILIVLTAKYASAQPVNEQQAVKSLCGCFEVNFKYAETFAADTAYTFHPRYQAYGIEWVVPEESSPNKFVLQHLLLAGDSMVIKHWREDWEFEKSNWLVFNHDAAWKQIAGDKGKIKGQWTQTVWEVDDAPRYQGSSSWINNNGKYYWESTADAPLPRREYTKRNDYNVLQRTNRIIITGTGWIHEQDNKKIIRTDGTPDMYLAEEKGYNIYKKTDDSKCRQAAVYWEKHRPFWAAVRQSWQEMLKDKNNIHLVSRSDGQYLYEQFDTLEKQSLAGQQLKDKLTILLSKYIEKDGTKQLSAK